MTHVIVAYASRYGSTAEVAEAIGKRLAAAGLQVDVTPAREVKSLDGFDGVVLAAPFYIGSLLKDARAFLDRHQTELTQRPVALATLGPTSAEDDLADARKQLDEMLAKKEWLKPVASEMFVGKYDPAALRGADKLLLKMPTPLKGRPACDDRDWDAINSWTDSLPALLGA